MALTRDEVLLEIQRALLGEVSARLRAVTIRLSKDEIHFDAYFDGPIGEDDIESMSCVDTELVAALPEDVRVSHLVHRADAPQLLPKTDTTVFLRRE